MFRGISWETIGEKTGDQRYLGEGGGEHDDFKPLTHNSQELINPRSFQNIHTVELPLDFHRNDKVRVSYRLKNTVKRKGEE